jgi:hydrogenase maturation protein HypF
MVKAAVLDLIDGVPAPTISARFHNTLARTTIEVARAMLAAHGDMPVVLSGGCFQNALLTESVLRGLAGERVLLNREIPPGDGGIALGQAVIAAAIVRAKTTTAALTSEVVSCV